MSDLIRTLRDIGPSTGVGILIDEAADQLEANAALIALLRTSLRKVEDEVEGLPIGVRIDCYAIPDTGIDILRACQLRGPDKWKVSNSGCCLNKYGVWEFEPLPSSRTDEFLARCRFDSSQEAIDAALATQKEQPK